MQTLEDDGENVIDRTKAAGVERPSRASRPPAQSKPRNYKSGLCSAGSPPITLKRRTSLHLNIPLPFSRWPQDALCIPAIDSRKEKPGDAGPSVIGTSCNGYRRNVEPLSLKRVVCAKLNRLSLLTDLKT